MTFIIASVCQYGQIERLIRSPGPRYNHLIFDTTLVRPIAFVLSVIHIAKRDGRTVKKTNNAFRPTMLMSATR